MSGGRQLLREGLLVERDPVKVLHRTRVGMFGEWKEAQCVRAQWVRDRQVYTEGWKGGHG